MVTNKLSNTEIKHIATLAKLTPKKKEEATLIGQVETTVQYISKLSEVDTTGIPPTSQVTGLTNVFREDKVDEKRLLTQSEALSNSKRTHNGYFVVNAIFEE